MAYYSLHAYDADVRIPFFYGLRQDDEMATDLRYAAEAENVETPNGVLQPQAGHTLLPESFGEHKIETLMQFHRRWYDGSGSKDWLVAAVDGNLYCKQKDSNVEWIKITLPGSVERFQCNVWSWVTYDTTVLIDPNDESSAITIDVLLISNAVDGMYMIIPPDRPTKWGDIKELTWGTLKNMTWLEIYSPAWHVNTVDTNGKKFGVIERFAERVWAAAIDGEPDMLMYSAPYDPTDWSANQQIPEDGAGEINQPSWDGDSFTALRAFGDQLVAFKGKRVWRVMGVSPGEYTFQEQYGGGTLYPNTLAVSGERIYLAERDGIAVYDGMTVNPFMRNFIEQFWKTVNVAAMDQMCAVLHKQKYYLAVPVDGSSVNNALIVYDTQDGSFLLYTDIYIESLMSSDDKLYATSSSLPGRIMEINYNSWDAGFTSGRQAKWTTPWMDFSYKTIAKGGYEIYFNPQVKGAPVTFRFSVQTEKKTKSKIVTIQPTTFREKQKRIRFGGTGRKFRVTIETLQAPSTAVWRLVGGVHMVVETDPD